MTLTYTSVDRMLTAYPRVAEVSAITSAHLATYAGDAEALVNAWIAQRYTVPVSGNPPLLVTLATDLAVYRTLALRVFTSERMNESAWPDRYKESMSMLERIAAGDIPLVTVSGDLVTEGSATIAGEVWSSKVGYLPTMTEVGPEGQQVFVVKEDKRVEMRLVTVGRTEEGQAIIAKGLRPGEVVVREGQFLLAPGSRVEIKDASKPSDAAVDAAAEGRKRAGGKEKTKPRERGAS